MSVHGEVVQVREHANELEDVIRASSWVGEFEGNEGKGGLRESRSIREMEEVIFRENKGA